LLEGRLSSEAASPGEPVLMKQVQLAQAAGPCRWSERPGIPGLKRRAGEFVPIAPQRVAAFGRVDVEQALIIPARDVICWIRRHVLPAGIEGALGSAKRVTTCAKSRHRRRPGEGELMFPYLNEFALTSLALSVSGNLKSEAGAVARDRIPAPLWPLTTVAGSIGGRGLGTVLFGGMVPGDTAPRCCWPIGGLARVTSLEGCFTSGVSFGVERSQLIKAGWI
jgi:hypothetical protein